MGREKFAQHFQPPQIDRLAACCELVSREPFGSVDELAACRSDVDILVTGWGSPSLSPDTLRALPSLRLVAHAAGTIKGIIDPAMLANGLRATTAACANAEPVAEYSLSWILRWNKRLDAFERDYRAARGSYDFKDRTVPDVGNFRSVVGIISASHVGRALIRLLQPFEFECLLYDPFLDSQSAKALGARKADLPELIGTSDVVSLNAPLLPVTERMFGASQFAAMKDGALFLNTARGRIVDHGAMAEALSGGRISAVLDVTDPEPLPSESPLWDMENVWITPHVAGSLGREIHRMTEWCLSEIERFSRGEKLLSEIGEAEWGRAA